MSCLLRQCSSQKGLFCSVSRVYGVSGSEARSWILKSSAFAAEISKSCAVVENTSKSTSPADNPGYPVGITLSELIPL